MAKKNNVWPRRIRRIVQAGAFVLFLLYIIFAPAMAVGGARGDWLMRFSPFAGLGASISAWQVIGAFWPALVLLILAIPLGRFFCGWLCPLGATLDAVDRMRGGAGTAPRLTEEARYEHLPGRRVKYYLLVASLVAAFLGVGVFGLFDPLSIAVRSYVLAVHAYVSRAVIAALQAVGLSGVADGVGSALAAKPRPVFALHLVAFLVFLAVVGLELVRRRCWCRYLCPLGAMYALAGKAALTKRSVSDACIECGRCVQACPTSCISPDGHGTLNDECILCLHCQAVCPTRAITFFASAPAAQKEEVDLTRRGALAAVAAGAAVYPALRIKPFEKRAKDDPLIRPPLAGRDVDEFLRKCLRCGQCMRACPTHVIQPAGLEAGVEGLWTPRLVPRLGYCVYECDACGRACPSGAIPPFTLEDKHATAMGLAYLDTTRCIPWRGWQRRDEEDLLADDHNCGVCEEVCPVPGKAIHFRRVYPGAPGQGSGEQPRGAELRLPYVREGACVGCGFCESACPLVGKAAIRVTGGFRELPAPEEAVVEPQTARALPARSGTLRLSGPKTTYTGPDELYDYINGAGEAYLKLNFIRVTTAQYIDDESKVQVDLWRFETTDDAYGAYANDRQGEPLDVGDEGSMTGASLWARRGRFMISVLDLTATSSPEQSRLLASTALEALDEEGAPRPEICRRLPREGLDPQSVLFLRDDAPLFDVQLADNFIPDGTFDIGEGDVAAYGAYDLRQDDRPAGLLLVHYGTEQEAGRAVDELARVRRNWGEEQVAREPYVVFKPGEGNYCVFGAVGGRFAAAFYMPTQEKGRQMVRAVLSE